MSIEKVTEFLTGHQQGMRESFLFTANHAINVSIEDHELIIERLHHILDLRLDMIRVDQNTETKVLKGNLSSALKAVDALEADHPDAKELVKELREDLERLHVIITYCLFRF